MPKDEREKAVIKYETPVPNRTYNQDDLNEILARAMGTRQSYNRQDLLTMAEELGISPQEITLAEAEWLTERDETTKKRFMSQRRRKVVRELVGWLGVGLLLLLAYISRLGSLVLVSSIMWVPWFVILVVLAIRSIRTALLTDGDDFENSYDKWVREQKKQRERAIKRRDLL